MIPRHFIVLQWSLGMLLFGQSIPAGRILRYAVLTAVNSTEKAECMYAETFFSQVVALEPKWTFHGS